jgi:hypothetical protein
MPLKISQAGNLLTLMRQFIRLLPLLLIAPAVTGCRYKGWESFYSATTSQAKREAEYPTLNGKIRGNPAGFGSLAGANGGLLTKTNYGAGADANSSASVNPAFDQPEKGSGQQAGEYPNEAAAGYAQDNGPALQPQPDAVGDVSAPLAHG